MTAYVPTASTSASMPTSPASPTLAIPAIPRLVAATGLAIGGLILAGLGMALPIAQGFVARGVVIGAAGDVALLDAVAPVAPLFLAVGVVHVAVGLAVAGSRWVGAAKGLVTVDALAGLAVVAMAAIAGTTGGDARTQLAGFGFATLIAAVIVGTALRAGEEAAPGA